MTLSGRAAWKTIFAAVARSADPSVSAAFGRKWARLNGGATAGVEQLTGSVLNRPDRGRIVDSPGLIYERSGQSTIQIRPGHTGKGVERGGCWYGGSFALACLASIFRLCWRSMRRILKNLT